MRADKQSAAAPAGTATGRNRTDPNQAGRDNGAPNRAARGGTGRDGVGLGRSRPMSRRDSRTTRGGTGRAWSAWNGVDR